MILTSCPPQGLCKAVKAHFAPVRTQTEQEEVLAVVRVADRVVVGGRTQGGDSDCGERRQRQSRDMCVCVT